MSTVISPYVESYRKELDELNKLSSPSKVFHTIDSFIKTYQSLKREYCMAWEQHSMYETKIRTFLRSKNPENRSVAISIKDIKVFVQKMRKLQQSVLDWVQDLSNVGNQVIKTPQLSSMSRHSSAPINSNDESSSSNMVTKYFCDDSFNIRPSHARTLSKSSKSSKSSNSSSTSSKSPNSPKASKSKSPKTKKRKKKSKSKKKKGKRNPKHSGSASVVIHENIAQKAILSIINDEKEYKPTIIDDDSNESKGDIDHLNNDEMSPMTLSLPRQISDHVKGNSVRSFGELFSNAFKISVASNYEKSIQTGFFLSNSKDGGDSKTDDDANHFDFGATEKQKKVVKYYHDNYYGQNEVFESPFGMRPVIYCDWTASGKVLECVETYLQREMLSLYANTHTSTSITGIQTSKFRSEARSIILQSLKGDHDKDVVIFTGSGVTGAINKISGILMKSIGKSYRPETTVIFISIYEHNSNIYIWKELGCKVIVIPENNYNKKKGGIDLKYLEKQLKFYTTPHMKHKYNLIIGSFTAASNVSGIIAPIDETTLLLHKYGALSFWDYATAGPYLDINMTNKDNPMLSKDAVFISTHKYLAGPGAPGILCAKKKLFQNYIPVIPGGGTVFAAYGVEDGEWEYLDNIEEREEGGTPDIIGSVRAAFTFMIKDHLSTHFIEQTEEKYLNYFLQETKSLKNLVIMGNTECQRLPVLSFLITHSQKAGFGNVKTKYLHYNFIAALFNDLWGIQGRGGCACAGMYGLYTLGMSQEEVDYVLRQMRDENNELARPGYFRINLHYTLTEKELKYIVKAVKYVCENGWRFLPLYDVNPETGNYFHRDVERKPQLLSKQLRSLLDISFDENDGRMLWQEKHLKVDGNGLNENLDKFFNLADDILNNLKEYLPSENEFKAEEKINDNTAWYWLPSELYKDAMHLCK